MRMSGCPASRKRKRSKRAEHVKKIYKPVLAGALLAALGVWIPILEAGAQTNRRPARVRPTPAPTTTVVSEADRYTRQSQRIIEGETEPQNAPSPTPTPTVEQLTVDEKLDRITRRLNELNRQIAAMESSRRNEYDDRQRRLMMNLDILTRAEQRAETLRRQLFELIEKENSTKTRLEQLEFDMRPESVDRAVAFAGTLRPEELRELRRKNLDVEKRNLQSLLTEIQKTRTNLEMNVEKADQLVEKLRSKLEKDIDEALTEPAVKEN